MSLTRSTGSVLQVSEGVLHLSQTDPIEVLTHQLILPSDTNHHGTLYAGELLKLALQAAYATAYRSIGSEANLVLARVLDIRCCRPVPVGTVVEIRGTTVHRARAHVVVGLIGSPFDKVETRWMDGLMQFAQINKEGRPAAIPESFNLVPHSDPLWIELRDRAVAHLQIRVRGRSNVADS